MKGRFQMSTPSEWNQKYQQRLVRSPSPVCRGSLSRRLGPRQGSRFLNSFAVRTLKSQLLPPSLWFLGAEQRAQIASCGWGSLADVNFLSQWPMQPVLVKSIHLKYLARWIRGMKETDTFIPRYRALGRLFHALLLGASILLASNPWFSFYISLCLRHD